MRKALSRAGQNDIGGNPIVSTIYEREKMITIDPIKKYTRAEIREFLCFDDSKMKRAEDAGLIKFDGNTMYGLFFFQFLKMNCNQLEAIHNNNHVVSH